MFTDRGPRRKPAALNQSQSGAILPATASTHLNRSPGALSQLRGGATSAHSSEQASSQTRQLILNKTSQTHRPTRQKWREKHGVYQNSELVAHGTEQQKYEKFVSNKTNNDVKMGQRPSGNSSRDGSTVNAKSAAMVSNIRTFLH